MGKNALAMTYSERSEEEEEGCDPPAGGERLIRMKRRKSVDESLPAKLDIAQGKSTLTSGYIKLMGKNALAMIYSSIRPRRIVPSMLRALTTEFGMGSGRAPSLKSPEHFCPQTIRELWLPETWIEVFHLAPLCNRRVK